MKMFSLSVVVPVYNEEATVVQIIKRVIKTCESLSSIIHSYEVIIVEDASQDSTIKILKDYFFHKPNIKLYFQEKNQGKGAAITRGFKEASGDLILIQDADLEYDPSDYTTLLAPFVKNRADVVYGSRFKGDENRVLYYWHYLGNKFLTHFSNFFTNLNLTDMETCYKIFRSPIVKNMILESKRFGIEPELTAKISKIKDLNIYEVPINYYGRTYKEGKKIGWKDGFSALWCILKFNLFTSRKKSFIIPPSQILAQIKKRELNATPPLGGAGSSPLKRRHGNKRDDFGDTELIL